MKNPANPGDFGTNGTRGVVLSGMSEKTKNADFPIGVSVSITQTCGKPASEFEMLTYAWYALGAKMRAAEGGVERETTKLTSGNWRGLYGAENRSYAVVRFALDASICGWVWVFDRECPVAWPGLLRFVRVFLRLRIAHPVLFGRAWWGGGLMDATEKLLSEALDLSVRARKMDEIDRRNGFLAASTDPEEWQQSGMFDDFVERWNHGHPDKQCATRSLTIAYWVAEQYRTDLADWERRAREHLMKKLAAGF